MAGHVGGYQSALLPCLSHVCHMFVTCLSQYAKAYVGGTPILSPRSIDDVHTSERLKVN